jgi:mono/diheme cytochrome c family protein
MRVRPRALAGIALAAGLALAACDAMPGKPRLADRERLPTEIMDFGTLYARNCAGCHGADGTSAPRGRSMIPSISPSSRERLRARSSRRACPARPSPPSL